MARNKKLNYFDSLVDRDISRAGNAAFERSNQRTNFDVDKLFGDSSLAKSSIAQVRGKSKTINSIFKKRYK